MKQITPSLSGQALLRGLPRLKEPAPSLGEGDGAGFLSVLGITTLNDFSAAYIMRQVSKARLHICHGAAQRNSGQNHGSARGS